MLQSEDIILGAEVMILQRENLLNGLFLCLIFKRKDKLNLLISRFAYNDDFLKGCIVIDPETSIV